MFPAECQIIILPNAIPRGPCHLASSLLHQAAVVVYSRVLLVAIMEGDVGWFLVSILLPLFAPIAAMWVFQRLPLPVRPEQKSLLVPIKDGQLCWGSVAFCALAMYELAVPGAEGALVAESVRGYANGGFILLMVPSAFLAAGGAIFPTEIVIPLLEPWHKYYEALATSLVLTILSGSAYTLVHYGLLKP